MSSSIVSTQNRVESPFIIVKIGDYTFGDCQPLNKGTKNTSQKVRFPNYINSMNITKVNGSVNMYTINITYAITQWDDPNMLDKIFSSVSNSREIVVSYGDWESPSFIYKEEKALITKVSQKVDFNASKIQYTIKCTSTASSLQSVKRNFGAKRAKPSEEILRLVNDASTGLQDIFAGMRNATKIANYNLIAMDDQTVQLEEKVSINVLDYISYLVKCMVSTTDDASSNIRKSVYYWCVYDDINNELGGTYFKVQKVTAGAKKDDPNTYAVDVGYPSGNFVTNFEVNSDDSWAILYKYSQKLSQPEYIYTIDDNGNIQETYSPSVSILNNATRVKEADKAWWTNMTQFPITARLTIKGLLRPAMLMSYVRVNCYFYGNKHVSSGLYIITKQEDTIDSNGYKTTISLTRVGGDIDYE